MEEIEFLYCTFYVIIIVLKILKDTLIHLEKYLTIANRCTHEGNSWSIILSAHTMQVYQFFGKLGNLISPT